MGHLASKVSSACLLPPSMSQHTTMLEDEQGFCNSRLLGGALLRLAPLEGLDLDLPVDAGKAATLLQHSLHHMSTTSQYPPPFPLGLGRDASWGGGGGPRCKFPNNNRYNSSPHPFQVDAMEIAAHDAKSSDSTEEDSP